MNSPNLFQICMLISLCDSALPHIIRDAYLKGFTLAGEVNKNSN